MGLRHLQQFKPVTGTSSNGHPVYIYANNPQHPNYAEWRRLDDIERERMRKRRERDMKRVNKRIALARPHLQVGDTWKYKWRPTTTGEILEISDTHVRVRRRRNYGNRTGQYTSSIRMDRFVQEFEK
jgi:hypothetical protein